jgi:hypothetical protein
MYLNNIVEQDHCGVKLRLHPMLGFKNFAYAATTIASAELCIGFARSVCTWASWRSWQAYLGDLECRARGAFEGPQFAAGLELPHRERLVNGGGDGASAVRL